MNLYSIILFLFVVSFLNCSFVVLGYFAGKHFKIVEIKENESIKIENLEKNLLPKNLLCKNNKKDVLDDSVLEYPDEPAYVISPEDEAKMAKYLRDIQNGEV